MRALAAVLSLTGVLIAETGPGLVLQPRRPGDRAALRVEVEQYLGGRTDSGAPLDLRWWMASGRWAPGGERGPVLGAAAEWLELDGADPRLPARLTDQSVAAGFDVGEWRGWSFRALAGLGFAGDLPYADGHAWYVRADLAATRSAGRGASWTILLSFDGSRAIFPDLPLPAVSYTRFVRPGLRYSLGLPFSTVEWEFAPSWTLRARVLPPITGSLEVSRRIGKSWEAYFGYEGRTAAFHVDGAPGNRRLLFGQRSVELGLRHRRGESVELALAGGFAFDRQFETGWDVRDAKNLARLDDVAYVRLSARFTW